MDQEIRYKEGRYVVKVAESIACRDCSRAVQDGTKARGTRCMEPIEEFEVGTIGRRGGWYQIGPRTKSFLAATNLCDVLAAM